MIDAPEGISIHHEISKPEKVPANAKSVDKPIIFLKSDVNRLAVACGSVRSERIRIIPTTLMFSTTVSATNVMVR